MRAAYFRGDGVIDITDVPTPVAGEGQLLIQVAANGVCGSDRKILRSGFHLIPGHEVAGTVVEAGPGCQTRPGARIAAYIPIHCGQCPFCRPGKGNLCPNMMGLLGWSTNGGYAEYMLVPDRNALPLEEGISFHDGVVLLDTIGASGHALRLSRCWEAESVLVIGAGPVGIGAVAGLKAFGVPRVYVTGSRPTAAGAPRRWAPWPSTPLPRTSRSVCERSTPTAWISSLRPWAPCPPSGSPSSW